MRALIYQFFEFFTHYPFIMNFDARAGVASKFSVCVISGNSTVQYPSVLPIVPPHAVLNAKWNSFAKACVVKAKARFNVFFIYSFRPPNPGFVEKSAPGKS